MIGKKSKTDNKNIKTYKFLLQPDDKQKVMINKTIGCARKVYNLILNAYIEDYKKYKENIKTIKATTNTSEIEIPKYKGRDANAPSIGISIIKGKQIHIINAFGCLYHKSQ